MFYWFLDISLSFGYIFGVADGSERMKQAVQLV